MTAFDHRAHLSLRLVPRLRSRHPHHPTSLILRHLSHIHQLQLPMNQKRVHTPSEDGVEAAMAAAEEETDGRIALSPMDEMLSLANEIIINTTTKRSLTRTRMNAMLAASGGTGNQNVGQIPTSNGCIKSPKRGISLTTT